MALLTRFSGQNLDGFAFTILTISVQRIFKCASEYLGLFPRRLRTSWYTTSSETRKPNFSTGQG